MVKSAQIFSLLNSGFPYSNSKKAYTYARKQQKKEFVELAILILKLFNFKCYVNESIKENRTFKAYYIVL